jgi:hypothetical protein
VGGTLVERFGGSDETRGVHRLSLAVSDLLALVFVFWGLVEGEPGGAITAMGGYAFGLG